MMFWLMKRQKPAALAQDILGRLNFDEQWALRHALAGEGFQYYGDGGTIHQSTKLDVETYGGIVVAVWFRCMPLMFTQHAFNADRASEMEAMYAEAPGGASIIGIEVGI